MLRGKRHIGIGLVSLLLLLILAPMQAAAISFDFTPVIIQIDGSRQDDSVGYDLVKDCHTFFYKSMLNGSVTLWETPAQKKPVSPNQLQVKEIEAGVQFIQCNELFLLEFWKVHKRQFYSETLGFSFYHRKSNGDLINFGYISAEDIQKQLKATAIDCNANGQYGLSYWDAITSKQFFFNIVKFGKADLVENPSMAIELKEQLFENDKIRPANDVLEVNKKRITCFVEPSADTTELGYKLCHTLGVHLNHNRHDYFNFTESPALSYLNIKQRLKVDKIEVKEVWERANDGEITHRLQQVRPYVNGRPMNWLNLRQLHDFNMFIDYRPYVDLLESKHYTYTITQVNTEAINAKQSSEVRRRLFTAPWNHITTIKVR